MGSTSKDTIRNYVFFQFHVLKYKLLYFQTTLEVCLYDEDFPDYDDLMFSMNIDVSSLTVGKKEIKQFNIDPEVKISNTSL